MVGFTNNWRSLVELDQYIDPIARHLAIPAYLRPRRRSLEDHVFEQSYLPDNPMNSDEWARMWLRERNNGLITPAECSFAPDILGYKITKETDEVTYARLFALEVKATRLSDRNRGPRGKARQSTGAYLRPNQLERLKCDGEVLRSRISQGGFDHRIDGRVVRFTGVHTHIVPMWFSEFEGEKPDVAVYFIPTNYFTATNPYFPASPKGMIPVSRRRVAGLVEDDRISLLQEGPPWEEQRIAVYGPRRSDIPLLEFAPEPELALDHSNTEEDIPFDTRGSAIDSDEAPF